MKAIFAPIKDTPGFTTSETSNQDQDDFNKMTLKEQIQQEYDEECYNYFDNIDNDDEYIAIDFDMFECGPTTEMTPTATTAGQNLHKNPPDAADTPIHTDTTIEETEEEQQHTR